MVNLPDLVIFLIRDAFWSGVASLGFAVLFNVPPRLLLGCALGGAIGHVLRTVLMETGVGIELATLVGAATIGLIGEGFARWWKAPVPIFTVCSVIPMIPGRFAFEAMIDVIQFVTLGEHANTIALVEASFNATKTALILGAIAFGIAAPRLLFHRPKPVV